MIQIKQNIIPVKRFACMAVYPFLFVRKDRENELDEYLLNHEKIHFAQQKELFLVGFYILYFIYWLKYGYRDIPFEHEAYKNQRNLKYLETRQKHAWRTTHKKGY